MEFKFSFARREGDNGGDDDANGDSGLAGWPASDTKDNDDTTDTATSEPGSDSAKRDRNRTQSPTPAPTRD